MKILYVSNMFPTKKHIYYGIHVQEQIIGYNKKFGVSSRLYFINALENGKIEYIKALFSLKKIITRCNPEIIHIHYGLSGLFLLFYKPKCKVFITLHGGDILPRQGKFLQLYLTSKILKRVDKAFILNNEMAEILSELKVPFEILPCGVDIDFFKQNQEKINFDNNKKTVVFPGDPARPVKNYSLFKEVLKEIKKKSAYNLDFKIVHNLERREVVSLLSTSDCLIMTSLSEGSPQIIKEALACNLPVVSVNVGDVMKVTENLPGCFVTDTYSSIELAEFVIKSFESDIFNLREKFIEKGLYDNNSVLKRLHQAYQD
ncbi:glycosyltransferase family 4 protein [Flavobacterium phragmitis]|uniref:Glycosyltransferase involved in cell wall bisynthesis n=1 Tax=Flavobacterium phragmitis TaxID=739143 RepID=A0A1I1P3K6_9FLAO|nr:glycosyltransferase family 4 protein [Flavobacterium phragmitis]SFD00540.1 Glycosyltransferase involved in cell wall bisynthesis [Flavobacterium phragmitis]